MPISPANMALYPGGSIRSPEWLAIREAVRERAGDKCEGCGVANGAVGIRSPFGNFLQPIGIDKYLPGDLFEVSPILKPFKVIAIVCTVAHLDPVQLGDHSLDNLRFWCQRCHNRHDAPMRAAGRKARANG